MPKLEFTILLLGAFQISVLAHYLISKLSENSITKAIISLAAASSSILILKPVLERNPVPGDYRTWFGIVIIVSIVLSVFAYIIAWLRGELEGEGIAFKTSVFALASVFFLNISMFVSLLFMRAKASLPASLGYLVYFLVVTSTLSLLLRRRKGLGLSRRWNARAIAYYLTVASFFSTLFLLAAKLPLATNKLIIGVLGFAPLIILLGIAVLRKGRVFHWERSGPVESGEHDTHLRVLSRIALVRVLFVWLIAQPVLSVAGTLGRVAVYAAFVLYVALEGAAIHAQLRIVNRAVHLLHQASD